MPGSEPPHTRKGLIVKIKTVAQILGALVLLDGVASAAAELKPFQQEAKEVFEKEIADRIKYTAEKCGFTIKVMVNFEAYDDPDGWKSYSIAGWCGNSLDALAHLCERKAYKPIVAKRINELHCLFGGKPGATNELTQANYSVSGKAFVYRMNTDHVNHVQNATAVLEKALNK